MNRSGASCAIWGPPSDACPASARQHVSELRPFDLALAVKGHELLLRPLAEKCGVELILEAPSGGAVVQADPQVLEQLLVLLAGEEILALAATDPERRIRPLARVRVRLCAQRERAVWTITSRSTSPGPARDEQPSSLLLAVADELDRSAGVVVAQRTSAGRASAGGDGVPITCTRLVLPLVTPVSEPLPAVRCSSGGTRLLIVDDDAAEEELVSQVLHEAGFQVSGLGPGELSIDCIVTSHADLILVGCGVDAERPGLLAELARLPGTLERLVLLGAPPPRDGGAGHPARCTPAAAAPAPGRGLRAHGHRVRQLTRPRRA